MEASETSQQPSAEEMRAAAEVAAAAGTAIAQSSTKEEARESATRAVQEQGEKSGLKLSKEDIHAIVDEMMERMSAMGVFEPPPAPVPSPAAPTPEQAAAVEARVESTEPRKRSFAERFAGVE